MIFEQKCIASIQQKMPKPKDYVLAQYVSSFKLIDTIYLVLTIFAYGSVQNTHLSNLHLLIIYTF